MVYTYIKLTFMVSLLGGQSVCFRYTTKYKCYKGAFNTYTNNYNARRSSILVWLLRVRQTVCRFTLRTNYKICQRRDHYLSFESLWLQVFIQAEVWLKLHKYLGAFKRFYDQRPAVINNLVLFSYLIWLYDFYLYVLLILHFLCSRTINLGIHLQLLLTRYYCIWVLRHHWLDGGTTKINDTNLLGINEPFVTNHPNCRQTIHVDESYAWRGIDIRVRYFNR